MSADTLAKSYMAVNVVSCYCKIVLLLNCPHILDLILTNKDESIHQLMVILLLYYLLILTIFLFLLLLINSWWLPSKTFARYIYNFPKADWLGLSEYRMDLDYTLCLNSSDVEFVVVNQSCNLGSFIIFHTTSQPTVQTETKMVDF